MFTLTSSLQNNVVFKDREYKIDLAFNNVLYAYEVIENDSLKEYNRINKALKAFIKYPIGLSIAERSELLSKIFERISEFHAQIDNYNYTSDGKVHSCLSYEKDSSAIYAAFKQAYQIDLYRERGKLHWVKFLMLLNNIPEDTKLSKIIGYRTMKVPPATSYNLAERQSIQELKSIYALEVSEDIREQNLNAGLAGIFNSLMQAANK